MEEKRIRARYGLTETKRLKPSHGIGEGPKLATRREWEIERLVEEYGRLLEDKKKEKNG